MVPFISAAPAEKTQQTTQLPPPVSHQTHILLPPSQREEAGVGSTTTVWETSHQSHFLLDQIGKKHVHTDPRGSTTASGPCTPGAGAGIADDPIGKGLQQAKGWWEHRKCCVYTAPALQAQKAHRQNNKTVEGGVSNPMNTQEGCKFFAECFGVLTLVDFSHEKGEAENRAL